MKDTDGISKNLTILNELKNLIKKEKEIEEKLKLLSIASYFASYNHTGQFCDFFIEKELVNISKQINIDLEFSEKNTVLHIATSVYEFGGHTKLIDRFIKNSLEKEKHSLILTKQDGKIPKWLANSIYEKNGEIITLTGTDINKSLRLRKYASKYEKIILHTHSFDTIPILAFGTKKFKNPVIFYNQADHIFWIGVSISDLVLDLSKSGQELSISKRCVKNTKILPVPLCCKKKSEISQREARKILNLPFDKKIILSIGTPNKFQPFGKFNFIQKAFEIINEIENSIVLVVGPSKKEKIWKDTFEKSKGRIIPAGIVERSNLIFYIKSADVYLESFPLTSSTATIEVILEGVPTVCVKNLEKSWDVIDKYSVDIENIIKEIKKVLNSKNTDNSLLENLKKMHCEKNWKKRLFQVLKYVPETHNLYLSSQPELKIDEYDKFIYKVLEKDEKLLYLRYFSKLKYKNKLKVLKIFTKSSKFKKFIFSLFKL